MVAVGGAPPSHINSNVAPVKEAGYSSFESLVLSLSHPTYRAGHPVAVLYRPPGPQYSEFLSEFSEF